MIPAPRAFTLSTTLQLATKAVRFCVVSQFAVLVQHHQHPHHDDFVRLCATLCEQEAVPRLIMAVFLKPRIMAARTMYFKASIFVSSDRSWPSIFANWLESCSERVNTSAHSSLFSRTENAYQHFGERGGEGSGRGKGVFWMCAP